MIKNRRFQYAVGQGGFHAGEVKGSDGATLSYVVDCGAMPKYKDRRDQCIDDYLADLKKKGRELDILFLTHAHADHVNGVERLLDSKTGIQVKAIVMPLLNVFERLLSYARTADNDPIAAGSSFYQNFIVDPAAALSHFEPGQLIFVESSDSDGGAPFSRDGDDIEPNIKAWPDTKDQPLWRAVGRGEARPIAPADGVRGSKNTSLMSVIPDSIGLMFIDSAKSKWLLAPYVDPVVGEEVEAFVAALASQLNKSRQDLYIWLADLDNVKLLVTQEVDKLAAAYRAVNYDLNVTSLIIYSGPIRESVHRDIYVRVGGRDLDNSWWIRSYNSHVGWIGTGDAALKKKERREAFFYHFHTLLDHVSTLMLPHHGSEGNFDESLLQRIKPTHCVVAADYIQDRWRHPGTKVVLSVASTGALLSVVTSSPASQMEEIVIDRQM